MGPLHRNTLYLHRECVLNTEAAMFPTVDKENTFWVFMKTESFHRFSIMFGRGGWGEGYSAATCNFTTRCHLILHTESLNTTVLGFVEFHLLKTREPAVNCQRACWARTVPLGRWHTLSSRSSREDFLFLFFFDGCITFFTEDEEKSFLYDIALRGKFLENYFVTQCLCVNSMCVCMN